MYRRHDTTQARTRENTIAGVWSRNLRRGDPKSRRFLDYGNATLSSFMGVGCFVFEDTESIEVGSREVEPTKDGRSYC